MFPMCTLFCHALQILTALIFLIAINSLTTVLLKIGSLRSGVACRDVDGRSAIFGSE